MSELGRRVRLIGREREVAEIDAAFEGAVASSSLQCAMVLGDPGVGKSRLAREVYERYRDRALVLSARAHRMGDTTAFGLWADALEPHMRGLSAGEIRRLCDGRLEDLASLLRSVAIARGDQPVFDDVPRARLLQALCSLVVNLASDRPVVVILDDVQEADASSWDLLDGLSRAPTGAGILVIALARPGELLREPLAMRVRLDLEQEGQLRRIALGPLTDASVADLAEEVLGEPLAPDKRRLLLQRSGGNALFAIGLLQALRREAGGPATQPLQSLPGIIAESVRTRAAGLSAGSKQILEVLAIAGGAVELGELTQILDRPLPELAPQLEELIDVRLVAETTSATPAAYEVAHPLIAETVCSDTTAARQLVVHHQLGNTLMGRGRLGEAALHFARSAEVNKDEAVQVLTQALGQADTRGAFRESTKLLGVLAGLLPEGDTRWCQVAKSLRNWIFEHRIDGDAQSASAALARIGGLPPKVIDDERRAAIKAGLATLQIWGTGELELAEHTASEAVQLFELVGDATRARIGRVEIAYARGLAGSMASLSEGASEVIADARLHDDDAAIASALGAFGTACILQGRFAEAEAAMLEAIEIARVRREPARVSRHYMNLAWSLGHEGRAEESLAAFSAAKAADPSWRESPLLGLEAMVRVLHGDYAGAIGCAEESAAVGYSLRRGVGQCAAGLALVDAGSPEAANDALDLARDVYGPHPGWWFGPSYLSYAEGVLSWRAGRLREAILALTAASQKLLTMQAPTFAAPVLMDLADIASEAFATAAGEEAATCLAEIATEVDRPLFHGMAAYAKACVAMAAGGFREAGVAAAAAAEIFGSIGYAPLRARSLVLLARSRQDEDRVAAVALLQEAAGIFELAGAEWRHEQVIRLLRGFGTAGRRAALSGTGFASLTTREHEVAQLTTRHLTAQQIADVLVLSRRTIESHLASIYSKLNVHSKGELIRVFEDAENALVDA